MARQRHNAGYKNVGTRKTRGSLDSEYIFQRSLHHDKYSLGGKVISNRPILHLDASKINGIDDKGNPNNGDSLSDEWRCLATNSYGRQLSTAQQVTWYSGNEGVSSSTLAGGDGANNNPYIYMNADYLHLTPGAVIARGRPFTFIYMHKPSGKFSIFGYPLETQSNKGHSSFFWDGNKYYVYHNHGGGVIGSDTNWGTTPLSAKNNTDHNIIVRRNLSSGEGFGGSATTSTTIHYDGNYGFSSSNTQNDELTLGLLGRATSSFYSIGRLYEVLAFDSYLSNADLNKIGSYLVTKYGISWTDFS